MKRWLLLALLPIALVVLAVGALAAKSSGGAQAEAVPGDTAACPAVPTDLDSSALIASLDASPLSDMASAEMSAKCYLVGIDRFIGGCGGCDLYVLRYLCYDPAKMNNGHNGWYYVNYWYCDDCPPPPCDGELEHGTTVGEYSYKGSSNCNNIESNWVDPISVVFYGGDYQDVQEHACDHGSWCFNDGGNQRFWSYGCWDQDANANSANPPLTQYHMRLLTGRSWDGSYACDDELGGYVLATPHHEYWGPFNPVCGTSGHSVDDNEDYPPGGFVTGRRDIVRNWVDIGGHHWRGRYNWGNTHVFRQSAGKGFGGLEGCWYAWSDGYVDFIGLWHG